MGIECVFLFLLCSMKFKHLVFIFQEEIGYSNTLIELYADRKVTYSTMIQELC